MKRADEARFTDAGEADRYVFCERPRCPLCGNTDLKTTRSLGADDSDRPLDRTRQRRRNDSQRKRCQVCGHKFILVWE